VGVISNLHYTFSGKPYKFFKRMTIRKTNQTQGKKNKPLLEVYSIARRTIMFSTRKNTKSKPKRKPQAESLENIIIS